MRTASQTRRLRVALAAGALFWAVSRAGAATQTPRFAHTATLLPTGDILVAGGVTTGGAVLNTAELKRTSKDASTYLGVANNMSTARSSATATMLANGCVLVAGGWSGAAALSDGDVYDPASNSFVAHVTGMSAARYSHTATLLNDGRVLLCGGMTDAAGDVTAACDFFTPTGATGAACGGSFSAAPSLQQARALHTAVLQKNGQVWIAGGFNPATPSVYLPTTERFNTAANLFVSGPPLTAARAYHTATMMGDGRVLVAGGFNGANVLNNFGILGTTEIYDPVANSVIPGPTLPERVEQHTSTLLADGEVMLYGGLANITTSFFTNKAMSPFDNGSTLSETQTGNLSAPLGNLTGVSASLPANFNLSAPVAGTIVNGEALFSGGVVTLPSGVVSFVSADPDNPATGLRANLSGVQVGCAGGSCGHVSADLTFENLQGQVSFNPVANIPISGNADPGGQVSFSGGPLTSAAGQLALTPSGSAFSIPLTVNISSELNNGNISSGTIAITGGAITQPSSYTVLAAGGIIVIPPGTPIVNNQITFKATVTGLSGQIQWNSSDPSYSLSSPASLPEAGAAAAVSLTGTMRFVASQVNLAGTSFSVNIATVVVRSMVSATETLYIPSQNQAAVGLSGGGEAYGHTATLLPDDDVVIAGGLDCSTPGTPPCASMAPAGGGTRRDIGLSMSANSLFAAIGGSINTPRAYHTSTLLPNGLVLVAGGTNGANVLGTGELFDPIAKTFTPLKSAMRDVRDQHTATLLPNGRVLLAGGFTTNAVSTGSTASCEIFYPETGRFLPTSSLNTARSNHTATAMPDGNVLVAGGFGANDVITATAEIYYSTSAAWVPIASMPAALALHSATLLQDGRLMVAGGVSASGVQSAVYAWNPNTNAWSSLASMPHALRSHTATLLFDGRVLVAGGDDGFGEVNASYIYDPAANSWSVTNGSPLAQPRFGHSATLLPDGAVMISGGTTRSGAIPAVIEVYRVDASSWTSAGGFATSPRAFHTMTLAPDGNVYAIGGSNGVIGNQGTSLLSAVESGQFIAVNPDQFTKNAPPSGRQAVIQSTGAAPGPLIAALGNFTVNGLQFRGGTEASGGGAAAANSSFSFPHLILQQIDGSGGGATQSNAGFALDLTTQIYVNAGNLATEDTSLSVALPSQTHLPTGWFNARVGANGVYSNGFFVQAGPSKPSAAPSSASGSALGVSSINWTWSAVPGGPGVVDGYSVYQASSGVFLGTAPAAGSPSFIQTGLAPGAAEAVVIAAFTISGDGPGLITSTVTTTAIPSVGSIVGSAVSPSSIQWSWLNAPGATGYNVYTSTGGLLATVAQNAFTDAGLGVNSARQVTVAAVTPQGLGPLSASATVYTQVDPPVTAALTGLTTGSFTLNWSANGNPSSTVYNAVLFETVGSSVVVATVTTTATTASFANLSPNTLCDAFVSAVNGDGSFTSSTLVVGSTFTLPNSPTSLQILGTTPVSISVQWSGNSNSTFTVYQVTFSTDDFAANIATAVPFSSGYTGLTDTIDGLLTSTTYWIRVQARNALGQTSQFSGAQSTITFNGGAPLGSMAGVFSAAAPSSFSGFLGNGRFVSMRAPAGAFPVNTTVTVSSFTAAPPALCPNGLPVALTLVDSPALQPTAPVYLTASYTPAEIGAGGTSQLALARFDPASGTCVPLQTTFDSVGRTFTAELNHFSQYQLVSIPLASDPGSARIYPNPFRSGTDGYVTIDGVPPNARVRIMTLRGETLLDQNANGAGLVVWGATNGAGRSVASGLYLVVIESGGNKKIAKLAVVR